LAEGQIAAKNSEAGGAECFGQCGEQWGLAVRSCAMGEYEAVREGIRRAMKEAAHGEIGG
jgi:hypothetical protein